MRHVGTAIADFECVILIADICHSQEGHGRGLYRAEHGLLRFHDNCNR